MKQWPEALVVLALSILIGLTSAHQAEAQVPLADTDADGLPDAFELYLASASAVEVRANPYDADSDSDGVPDGFEYLYTEQVRDPATPTYAYGARVAAHRVAGENFARVLFMASPDPSSFDKLEIATATLDGGVTRLASTSLFAGMVTGVGFGHWGPHTLYTFEIQVPLADLRTADGGIAFGIVGELGGTPFGDQLSAFVDQGELQLFDTPTPAPAPPGGGGGPGGQAVESEIRPGVPMAPGWIPDEVCGSIEHREPTGTPGLLRSVVESIGCTAGAWACPAGVCTMGGAASIDKPVLDVFALITPAG